MSQRCLISLKKNVIQEDDRYDCIYDEDGNLKILLDKWLCLSENGCYLGGWKLFVRNEEILPKFMEDFVEIKKHCPMLASIDDLSVIYVLI